MARRWREHQSGKAGARYFRGRKPTRLGYLEAHLNRSSASQREYAIKTLNAAAKKLLIAEHTMITQQLIGLYNLEELPH